MRDGTEVEAMVVVKPEVMTTTSQEYGANAQTREQTTVAADSGSESEESGQPANFGFQAEADGPIVRITFPWEPVGLQYNKAEIPFKVTTVHPGGLAESVGVQVGWSLVEVRGVSVAGKSRKEISAMIKAATSSMATQM